MWISIFSTILRTTCVWSYAASVIFSLSTADEVNPTIKKCSKLLVKTKFVGVIETKHKTIEFNPLEARQWTNYKDAVASIKILHHKVQHE